ncbi:hypothetical protein CQW23_16520 [Capsicum baccatum]|uniref:Ubiquitin-like protease family profile domain-containing protein n=1 Tax=Capsicum baccatum TaxID=33114 RepID=A0A2G2WB68_CAPBA|nr:hypothetical protein CQW23_16520 [Capsicum baccatum]
MRTESWGYVHLMSYTSLLAMNYAEFRHACAYRELYSMYVYTNISPTVDELKCLQLPNHAGMDLKDFVNSTLPSTSCRQQKKVDHTARMADGSLSSNNFDDFTTPPPIKMLIKLKALIDYWHRLQKEERQKLSEKKLVIGQEKIKAHPSIKEVNESPFGTSNSIADPTNEEAPHEPSLMDFAKQTPAAEQTLPVVKNMRQSTQNINVSGGTNHEQIDKRFDDIEALMKKHHEEMKNQHKEMMLAVKKKHDAYQKNNDENIISTGDHKQDEKPSTESSLKFNFDDPAISRGTIEVQNVQKVSSTEISSNAFKKLIDIIASMSTPVVAMSVNSDDISQKVNLPYPSFQIDNVEVSNEPQHVDVIFHYLWKKSKHQKNQEYQYTTVNSLFKTYIDATYKRYFEDAVGDALSSQDDYKRDCGVFVAAYAEFLSERMSIFSSNVDPEYLRKGYATLI